MAESAICCETCVRLAIGRHISWIRLIWLLYESRQAITGLQLIVYWTEETNKPEICSRNQLNYNDVFESFVHFLCVFFTSIKCFECFDTVKLKMERLFQRIVLLIKEQILPSLASFRVWSEVAQSQTIFFITNKRSSS